MIAFGLPKIKDSMAKLLLSDTFDQFLFVNAEIVTFNTFTIDGYLKKEFFDSENEPTREYALWKDVRDYCYAAIKGHRTPLHFSFVLRLSDENTEKFLASQNSIYTLDDVKGLFLNIRFDGEKLTCTSGTSMKTFTLDKSVEEAWDQMIFKFCVQKEMEPEKLL